VEKILWVIRKSILAVFDKGDALVKTWKRWWVLVLVVWMGAGVVWAEQVQPPAASSPAQEQTGAAKEVAPSAPAAASVPMEQTPHWSIIYLGAAASAGVIILGAAYGIAKIGSSAVESMARQPEAAGSINTAMIVSAALIEGVTFFALIVCLLSVFFK
jgi:F-type H+-transporting ATPase subunit c